MTAGHVGSVVVMLLSAAWSMVLLVSPSSWLSLVFRGHVMMITQLVPACRYQAPLLLFFTMVQARVPSLTSAKQASLAYSVLAMQASAVAVVCFIHQYMSRITDSSSWVLLQLWSFALTGLWLARASNQAAASAGDTASREASASTADGFIGLYQQWSIAEEQEAEELAQQLLQLELQQHTQRLEQGHDPGQCSCHAQQGQQQSGRACARMQQDDEQQQHNEQAGIRRRIAQTQHCQQQGRQGQHVHDSALCERASASSMPGSSAAAAALAATEALQQSLPAAQASSARKQHGEIETAPDELPAKAQEVALPSSPSHASAQPPATPVQPAEWGVLPMLQTTASVDVLCALWCPVVAAASASYNLLGAADLAAAGSASGLPVLSKQLLEQLLRFESYKTGALQVAEAVVLYACSLLHDRAAQRYVLQCLLARQALALLVVLHDKVALGATCSFIWHVAVPVTLAASYTHVLLVGRRRHAAQAAQDVHAKED